ncbi:hypothetical protein AGR4C_Cc80091 [Agrobacterium tumefaciens str. Kerr 14]|uniref:Uncharacterized protein n=3 Tax=Agrobacterium TaxID=357 RepID=A0A1S7PM87_9HYPH|nr:hypothetical protein AGR1C_Cc11164 [Agrobacterium fabacearum TT111]CUX23001.1 hypothetical protein AGR4B_Cc61023 [Agrobacterium tumefaciens str. CFBP 5621]CUX23315.1 hypothetical protein AGR7C_Cc160151 [Agrobacterium deltaense Zutra 3/1]CUX30687.1 hypothetical protein AGR7B_Cc50216 [Agrobacterium deltaense RV3]CUX36926.1 hypothetical protein AGR4C_Cc80091 [Agrobacterium tumefaciens str. Kerr 14]CVI55562.1 hypothetical protein AGR7A_Cc210094 [Agrobacterium deltaense NCPPB 1641]
MHRRIRLVSRGTNRYQIHELTTGCNEFPIKPKATS